MEEKELNASMVKLNIISEYIHLISNEDTLDVGNNKHMLYVVEVDEGENADGTSLWNG